jgi:lipid-A-disaccharide synthase
VRPADRGGGAPIAERTLFVAAAEPSGDRLAAALVPSLRARVPGLRLVGMAGPAMRAAGVEAVARAEDAVGFGLVEVVGRVPRYLRLLDGLERALVASRADVVLTVDAPSLLLRFGRRARARDRAVVHWVAPQVWAWRARRVEALRRSVSALMCLLPFEPPWFAGSVRAVFVGHPAAAIVPVRAPLRPGTPTVGLCPGSRPGEVAALWPVLREVARRVREVHPAAGFVVPRAPGARLTGLDAVYVDTMAEVAGADAAVVASGTATLELAALDVPMVAVYRVHPLTAAVARRLLTIDAVALPNVLAGRRVVPEHLQDLDPAAIARDLLALIGVREQVPRDLIASLKGPTALDEAADEVARWLS